MKNLFLLCCLSWLAFTTVLAQNTSLPKQLKQMYSPLDKSQINSGYLFDLSVPFVEPSKYTGILTDSNYVDMTIFGFLYGEMSNCNVGGS